MSVAFLCCNMKFLAHRIINGIVMGVWSVLMGVVMVNWHSWGVCSVW